MKTIQNRRIYIYSAIAIIILVVFVGLYATFVLFSTKENLYILQKETIYQYIQNSEFLAKQENIIATIVKKDETIFASSPHILEYALIENPSYKGGFIVDAYGTVLRKLYIQNADSIIKYSPNKIVLNKVLQEKRSEYIYSEKTGILQIVTPVFNKGKGIGAIVVWYFVER